MSSAALAWPPAWRSCPLDSGLLDVGDGHEVAWWSIGPARGKPVVVVHGGPGSGSNAATATFFEPERHRLVFFDQRGCGASLPTGRITANTTDHAIEDMERLRRHLGLERWLVFGGSWGAALGLAYCQQAPEATLGAVLRGLPRVRAAQERWVLEERAERWPEHAEAFLADLPEGRRHAPAQAHLERLLGSDPARRAASARAVMALEYGLTAAEPQPLAPLFDQPVTARDEVRARIYLHYWVNDFFLPGGDALDSPARLADTPLVLVHGVKDWICPVDASRAAAERLPGAQLVTVEDGGHSPFSPPMRAVLTAAVERLTE